MTWARLDDSMGDHPKIVGLSDKAFRAHILGILYCAKHLTDGHIPGPIANRFSTKTATSQLVAAGIWERTDDGYVIHDYGDYQPTREHVLEEREKVKRRVHKWRERNAVTNPVSNAPPAPAPIPSSTSTPTEVADRGISPGRTILPKRLQRIVQDEIRDGLTAAQAETVARAWHENDVELRQSMAQVEAASNPVAYLISVATRISPATGAA